MLEVSGLSKYYNALPAVRDVTFTVQPGEVLGYLGPNGSGKSTTVKMLVGLLVPTQGTIRFRGADIQDHLIAHKARVGYVSEEERRIVEGVERRAELGEGEGHGFLKREVEIWRWQGTTSGIKER